MSQAFPAPLLLEPLTDGRRWKVAADFLFHGEARVVLVPAGFVTDFASTPRATWWLLPPWGKYGRAALVHDFLYATQPCPKAEADAVFLEGMRLCGVGKTRRWVMFLAVLLFGRAAWRSHQHGRRA